MNRFIAFVIFAAFSAFTFSHELSNGYLTLKNSSSESLLGELLLKPEDIGRAAGLDINNDGSLTWGEVNRNHNVANDYIQKHLVIRGSETRCSISVAPPSLREISAESLLAYPLSVNCASLNEVSIQYTGIVNNFPTHKLLTTLTLSDSTNVHVLTDERPLITVSAGENNWISQFNEMVYQGIWHIFIGLDHILFLVATLLTVNLYRENKSWVKKHSKQHIIKSTVILVSTFTLAHSITLTATALNVITLESRIVELGIAISVVVTAINNVYPVIMRLGFITFGFGLLHGMGFASVFGDLNAQSNSLVVSVLAFNLGVEIGQLAIIVLLLPLLILLRNIKLYSKAIMPIASSIIALVAINWTLQRW
ncbi:MULTISPECIES: HupE/UreJ family protein [unclassified Alteromonas]|uniref:HupE/UreJ family protein n=1 Tax=unclassified Alteromonas TaxID=2614992 RepID=UPI001E302458|nr:MULTISPECIES: HupE/UreJ family protein [unclassified Alteromonas]